MIDTCLLYGGHEEDLMHLFLSCLFALSCWSQVDLIPSVNGVSSFFDWFFMFLTNVDKEVVGACWVYHLGYMEAEKLLVME